MGASQMNAAKRILVVDDHPLLRLGITSLLLRNYEVFEADDLLSSVRVLNTHPIDVATVDIELESGSGLTVLRQIRATSPATKCLVVTQYMEPLYQSRARLIGAHGFVGKRSIDKCLVEAIETVMRGGFYPAEFAKPIKADDELGSLSDRELEIFSLLGEGRSTAEIAESFGRSRKTIEAFRDRIKIKLGVDSTPKLVRMATHWYLSAHEKLSN